MHTWGVVALIWTTWTGVQDAIPFEFNTIFKSKWDCEQQLANYTPEVVLTEFDRRFGEDADPKRWEKGLVMVSVRCHDAGVEAMVDIIEPSIPKPQRKNAAAQQSDSDAFLAAEAAVAPLADPIVEDPKWPRQPRNQEVRPTTWDQFQEAVLAERRPVKTEERPAPALTPRQKQTLEEEMEAGRRRVQRNQEELLARPVHPPDPGEGHNVPVFRPSEYTHERNLNKVRG